MGAAGIIITAHDTIGDSLVEYNLKASMLNGRGLKFFLECKVLLTRKGMAIRQGS